MEEFSNAPLENMKVVADRLLTLGLEQGATSGVVNLHQSQGLTVQLNGGRVASRTRELRSSFTLTLYRGHQRGQVISTCFEPQSLIESVQAALTIARYTGPDISAGLAEAQWLCQAQRPLDLHHPWNIDLDDAVNYARRLEDGVEQSGVGVRSETARVTSGESWQLLATTEGFSNHTSRSAHSIMATALARADGQAEKEYGWDAACDPKQLVAPEIIGKQAADLALQYLKKQPLSTRRCRVLFSPRCAATLCGHLIEAVTDRALYMQASFLKDQLGNPVTASHLTLKEDPFIIGGYASFPFDSDGIEPRARNIVEKGVLQGYQLSLYGARRLGLAPTGNGSGTGNLILSSDLTETDEDLLHMVTRLGTGLYVTSLAGDGVQIFSGDYSRVARGFWVEQGHIQYAVTGAGISGNLNSMLMSIEAVGNDVARFGAYTTGSILIDSMHIAGINA